MFNKFISEITSISTIAVGYWNICCFYWLKLYILEQRLPIFIEYTVRDSKQNIFLVWILQNGNPNRKSLYGKLTSICDL